MILSILVGDFRMLAIWICIIYMYVWSNSPILVGDVVNTGEGTFSKIWAGLRSKPGILKTWGVMPRYGIKNKKNQFGYRSAPLSILCPINYIR